MFEYFLLIVAAIMVAFTIRYRIYDYKILLYSTIPCFYCFNPFGNPTWLAIAIGFVWIAILYLELFMLERNHAQSKTY